MSPTTLAVLRRIETDTRRLAQPYPVDGWERREPMPLTDFYRPVGLLRLWHGPGSRYHR